jgi:hypothetical protein
MSYCQTLNGSNSWHCHALPRQCHQFTRENIEGATRCQVTAPTAAILGAIGVGSMAVRRSR